jgi:predicted negative regulator of RcsB-dependent stress response
VLLEASWQEVAIAALGVVQVVGLAWVAAWQQRAAALVRQVNGQAAQTHELVKAIAAGAPAAPSTEGTET